MNDFLTHGAPPRSGRLTRWGPTLFVAAVLGLYFWVTRPAPPPAGWGDDYSAAVADARQSRRHLVLAFYSEGCPPCAAMDRTVLGTAAVREALNGFVPVRLEVGRSPALAAEYEVLATPTFVITDARGQPLARREGYQSVEAFVAFLRSAAPSVPKIRPT